MKNVAVIGAGAVGAYFIWGMEENSDINLFLVAEGERKGRLEAGIMINGELHHPKVLSPEQIADEEKIDIDVIFVATKAGGLDDAIEILKRISGENTVILSLLNGVDSEEKIRKAGVTGTVINSIMRIASRRDENGIVFDPELTAGVFFGAAADSEKDTVSMLSGLLDKTKVNYKVVDNIIEHMWLKYGSNIANNLPQAVLFTDASLYVDSEHGRFIAERLWEEVRAVATAKGIYMPEKAAIFVEVPKTSKYSTLQDLMAGRHTEIDMFAGHLIEMADEFGIKVPYTEYTYHAIKALEEKNDGIIGK